MGCAFGLIGQIFRMLNFFFSVLNSDHECVYKHDGPYIYHHDTFAILKRIFKKSPSVLLMVSTPDRCFRTS